MTSTRRAILAAAAAVALVLSGTGPASAQEEPTARPDARRAPVTFGLILQTEGLVVTPEVGTATDAMVAWFNDKHRGVDGHRMVVDVCETDDTAASAVACAEQFASDGRVHLVMESTTHPAAIADVLVPAGKPLLAGGVDFGNMLRPGVSVMEPGAAGIAHALFTHAATDSGVTHLTAFLSEDPAIAGARPVIELIAATAGMTVDFVSLGFGADLSGPIAAGIADGSDGLAFVVAPSQCAPVGQALDTLGVDLPVFVAELCLTDEIMATGLADGWYAGTQSVLPVVNGGREADKARRILARYGDDADTGGLAGLGVGFTWVAHDVLVQAGAGRATDASVARVLRRYASTDVLGFDRVRCPGPAPFVAACNASTLIVQVQDGELHDVGGFTRTDFRIFEPLLGGPPS